MFINEVYKSTITEKPIPKFLAHFHRTNKQQKHSLLHVFLCLEPYFTDDKCPYRGSQVPQHKTVIDVKLTMKRIL